MTTAPFEPDPAEQDEIAAADPGRGAPDPAPGFGPTAIDPDQAEDTRRIADAAERDEDSGQDGEPTRDSRF